MGMVGFGAGEVSLHEGFEVLSVVPLAVEKEERGRKGIGSARPVEGRLEAGNILSKGLSIRVFAIATPKT